MLKIVVANDDITPMDFVVALLEEVFEKSRDEAIKIMLEAHREGQATCGVYAESRARDLASQATAFVQGSAFPLRFSLVDAGPPQ